MCVGMYICTQAHYMLNTLTNSSCKNLIRLETDYTWTAGRSNQSILKEISPGISLEGMMRKLKLQYFGHLMWRVDSLEKTLMLGGIEGRRRKGQQRMSWLDGITDSMDMSLSELWELVMDRGSQRIGQDWVTELNWTEGWMMQSQGKRRHEQWRK